MQRPSDESLRKARATLRTISTDAPSHLPSLNLIADALRQQLELHGRVALLYVHLERYGRLEALFGWRIVPNVLDAVAQSLTCMAGSTLRQLDAISDFTLTDDAFLVLLSPPRRGETILEEDVTGVMRRVHERLESLLLNDLSPGIYDRVHPTVGAALLSADDSLTFEQSLEQGVALAMQAADDQEAAHFVELEKTLATAIVRSELEPLFEPVVDPQARLLVGYRTTVRGPFHSPLRLPDVLLDVAQRSTLQASYGVAARMATVGAAQDLQPSDLLFLECASGELPNAAVVALSEFYSLNPLLVPQHVVFELAAEELRTNVAATLRTLGGIREMGFQICIAGLGVHCMTLEVAAEVRPEFLCLDPSLVADIATNPTSVEIVQLLVRFAGRAGAQLIATGVHDAERQHVLARNGVELFCGDLYGRADTCPRGVTFTP